MMQVVFKKQNLSSPDLMKRFFLYQKKRKLITASDFIFRLKNMVAKKQNFSSADLIFRFVY